MTSGYRFETCAIAGGMAVEETFTRTYEERTINIILTRAEKSGNIRWDRNAIKGAMTAIKVLEDAELRRKEI